MNDFTKIIGNLQIKDNSIDIDRLEIDFLKNKNWKINGSSSSKFTITTIPDPINADDVANKHYIDFSRSLNRSYINTIYADRGDTGFIAYDEIIHDNTIIGIINKNLIIQIPHNIIAIGNVKIHLNGNVLLETDLISVNNANNSYIEFSDELYYYNNIDENYKYLTAKICISVNDMQDGLNSLFISHDKSQSNTLTWINEKNLYPIMDSSTLSNIIVEDVKYLSGIEYISKAYFNFNIEISNLFKHSFSDLDTPIHYICDKLDIEPDQFPVINSSNDILRLSKRIDIKYDRLNFEACSIHLEIHRPSRDSYIGPELLSDHILFDSVEADSTFTIENFNDEVYRLKSDFTPWDSHASLTSDLMVSNGKLHYAKTLTGECYYYRSFIFTKQHHNFIIEIESESTDFVTVNEYLTNNNIKIEIFINDQWKDIVLAFNGNENDPGCFAANIENKIPFSWGFTLGLNFTSTILLRITAPSSWNGSISKMSLIGL